MTSRRNMRPNRVLTCPFTDERIQPPYTLPTTASQGRTKPAKPALSARTAAGGTGAARGGAGTAQVAFNTSGTLLLVRSMSAPAAVLLYDFPSPLGQQQRGAAAEREKGLAPRLRSVLLHEQPVIAARWNPDPGRAGRLAVACGSQSVYLWSDEWVVEDAGAAEDEEDTEVAECVGVPARECSTCVFQRLQTDIFVFREVRDERNQVGAGREGDDPPGPRDVLLRVRGGRRGARRERRDCLTDNVDRSRTGGCTIHRTCSSLRRRRFNAPDGGWEALWFGGAAKVQPATCRARSDKPLCFPAKYAQDSPRASSKQQVC